MISRGGRRILSSARCKWGKGRVEVNNSSAGYKEATSAGHQRPNQNHTATFHPFGTKGSKKKTAWWQRDVESVSLCFQYQLVPKLQHVRAQPEKTWTEGQQGRKRRGSEGGVPWGEWEEGSTIVLTHIPGQQQLIHTHTHTLNTLASQSDCEKQTSHSWCQDTSAGINKMYCKISGLQLFSLWSDWMLQLSNYWTVTAFSFPACQI